MTALSPFTIVELAETVAGEYCGKLLADFGAEVIKVERPGVGSPTRRIRPFANGEPSGENSALFAYLNTNKKSVAVDVSAPSGCEQLDMLLTRAHAVIDDHPPGWLEQLGLGEARATATDDPLVICSITPFGQTAPPHRTSAVDLTVFHASGWGFHTPTGADPAKPPLNGPGRFLPSYEAGLEGALTVAACLYDEGQGRFIDLSMQAVLAGRVDYVLGQMIAGDMDVSDARHMFDLGGPAGIFPCKDGFVYLWMSAPAHWEAVRELMGAPEWMKAFPDNWLERGLTPERIAQCRTHLCEWLANEDKEAVTARAQKLGLTMAPVNQASDLLQNPQYQHRSFFQRVEHPSIGPASYPGVPYRLSKTPASITSPAPSLDADNHGGAS